MHDSAKSGFKDVNLEKKYKNVVKIQARRLKSLIINHFYLFENITQISFFLTLKIA